MEKNYKGLWGNPTSTIDWCESNYEVSYYIAEFWNTVSNFIIVLLSLTGYIYAKKDNLETRFLVINLFSLLVGIGSALFHGTLLYHTQLMDEIPLLYGTACFIYIMKEVSSPPNTSNKPCIITLTITCAVVTTLYILINNPLIFQLSFTAMAIICLYYSFQIVRKYKHSQLLFRIGLVLFIIAAILWVTDRVFCNDFKSMRMRVGYPLKPLIQGHAWWHFFMMLAIYLGLLFNIHARSCYLKKEPQLQLYMGCIPVVTVYRENP